MAHVRDRPSLRESVEITTPAGNRYRWSDDEDGAANVPSGERYADTMPGGFSEHDAVLPRKANIDYADLERLSTLTRYDASGGIVWQGRLERAPKVSGDQMAISPSAVGWQAALEDDKSASTVYLDRDLSRFTDMSNGRRLSTLSANIDTHDFIVEPDLSGAQAISPRIHGAWARRTVSEPWYDAGAGNALGRFRASFAASPQVDHTNANWSWQAHLATSDQAAGLSSTAELATNSTGTFDLVSTVADQRHAFFQLQFLTGPDGSNGVDYYVFFRDIRLYGDHGLAIQAGSGAGGEGLLASDIVTHAVGRWAPSLMVTTTSVLPSSFLIPHLAFYEPTTAGEIIRQATRFGLQDWGVWEDLTFWWYDRGAVGKRWQARVGPARLEETGPQVERIWESVVVQYQDVDGSTRTVGPVGSGKDTETDDLKDDDPDNPANKLGITRRALLTMGIGTSAGATEIGRRFLEESKVLDSSGRAQLVGHVQDSHGVWHPYSHVRAGDKISFVDSSDTSYRRIVRTDKTRGDRSCSIDLDAPPEGLAALLERLGVVLVPLGV